MKLNWVRLSEVTILLLAVVVGNMVGRLRNPDSKVHAQEKFGGVTNCVTVVPKSWGQFKGGSDYGLAFQDDNGVVRFVLHPTCGSINSPAEPPTAPIDLEVQRR